MPRATRAAQSPATRPAVARPVRVARPTPLAFYRVILSICARSPIPVRAQAWSLPLAFCVIPSTIARSPTRITLGVYNIVPGAKTVTTQPTANLRSGECLASDSTDYNKYAWGMVGLKASPTTPMTPNGEAATLTPPPLFLIAHHPLFATHYPQSWQRCRIRLLSQQVRHKRGRPLHDRVPQDVQGNARTVPSVGHPRASRLPHAQRRPLRTVQQQPSSLNPSPSSQPHHARSSPRLTTTRR